MNRVPKFRLKRCRVKKFRVKKFRVKKFRGKKFCVKKFRVKHFVLKMWSELQVVNRLNGQKKRSNTVLEIQMINIMVFGGCSFLTLMVGYIIDFLKCPTAQTGYYRL